MIWIILSIVSAYLIFIMVSAYREAKAEEQMYEALQQWWIKYLEHQLKK